MAKRNSRGVPEAAGAEPEQENHAGRELVLGGYRGKAQRRTGRHSDFTQAKADKFIQVLADSCNVTLAARAIGRSVGKLAAAGRVRWRARHRARSPPPHTAR